jgi:hypothetical protein
MVYVYSFIPKSELIGFITFFIINVIACFFDMVLHFIAVFSQAQALGATSITNLATVMNNLTWVLVVIFPCVTFKRALFNIRLKSNSACDSSLNSLMFTDYSYTEPWMSAREPGLGIQFIIFCAQMIFWWIVLILIENGTHLKLICRRSCCCNNDLKKTDGDDGTDAVASNQWNDTVCQKKFVLIENFIVLFFDSILTKMFEMNVN